MHIHAVELQRGCHSSVRTMNPSKSGGGVLEHVDYAAHTSTQRDRHQVCLCMSIRKALRQFKFKPTSLNHGWRRHSCTVTRCLGFLFSILRELVKQVQLYGRHSKKMQAWSTCEIELSRYSLTADRVTKWRTGTSRCLMR